MQPPNAIDTEYYDYGIIPLRPLYWRNLEIVGKEYVCHPTSITNLEEYDLVVISGVPQERMAVRECKLRDGGDLDGTVRFSIENLPAIPLANSNVPVRLGDCQFAARVLDVPELGSPVGSVVGMSGGPIFGIKFGQNDFRMDFVGLQTDWLPRSRTIVGGWMRPFVEAVEMHLCERDSSAPNGGDGT